MPTRDLIVAVLAACLIGFVVFGVAHGLGP